MSSERSFSNGTARTSTAFAKDREGAMMQPKRYVAVCFLALTLLPIGACTRNNAAGVPEGAEVQFNTADGFRIHGTMFSPEGERPPGLILVHMLGSDRSSWRNFARKAQQAGFMCLAYDMRGHGESTLQDGQPKSFAAFTDADWAAATADIEAAKKALVEQGADPANLAIIGASIGANLALVYAQGDRDIQTVVMLSPGLDYKSIRTESVMKAYPGRPVLLMASESDTYSAKSCAVLKEAAQGYSELRGYGGTAHGTDLLVPEQAATGQILMWLGEIMQSGQL